MLIKTLLNRVHPVKGFVYEKVNMVPDATQLNDCRLDVRVRPRRGTRGICSSCGRRGPGYDTLADRRFDFVPLWGIAVVLIYAMRRIDCDRCGVKVEQVPWAAPGGKHTSARALQVFLAGWAKRLSWREVGVVFGFSWERVFRSVQAVVAYGLAHRDLSGIEAIGVSLGAQTRFSRTFDEGRGSGSCIFPVTAGHYRRNGVRHGCSATAAGHGGLGMRTGVG